MIQTRLAIDLKRSFASFNASMQPGTNSRSLWSAHAQAEISNICSWKFATPNESLVQSIPRRFNVSKRLLSAKSVMHEARQKFGILL